jgi:hypothetical protein
MRNQFLKDLEASTRFWVNWAFLIALEALKPSLRSWFNLVPRAIRKEIYTETRCI